MARLLRHLLIFLALWATGYFLGLDLPTLEPRTQKVILFRFGSGRSRARACVYVCALHTCCMLLRFRTGPGVDDHDQIDSDRQLGTHLGFPEFRAGSSRQHRGATIGFQSKQPMGCESNLLIRDKPATQFIYCLQGSAPGPSSDVRAKLSSTTVLYIPNNS